MKRDHDVIVVVVEIHMPGHHQLLCIIEAINALGLLLGFGQRGQEHARKDRDNGNHHQKFNERKPANLPWIVLYDKAVGVHGCMQKLLMTSADNCFVSFISLRVKCLPNEVRNEKA